jgi:hypothetical protein
MAALPMRSICTAVNKPGSEDAVARSGQAFTNGRPKNRAKRLILNLSIYKVFLNIL